MSRQWVAWSGLALLCAAVVALVPAVDVAALRSTWRAAAADPAGLAVALALYLAAFVGRAALMSRTLPSVPLRHSLAALHVALAGNKLLPLRLGEALRITSVVRRTGVSVAEATASTVLLRGADVLAVVLLAAVLGPQALAGSLGAVVWVVAVPAAALVVAGVWWVRRLGGRVPGPTVAVGAVAAWILESGVVWQAARWAGIALSPADAVLVTAVVTVAQVAAVAPGGLGTYEAAATGALVALGAPAGPALAAALTAHAVNTAYALAAGAVAVAVPAPGLLGRWRLPRAPAAPDPAVA
ncbi:MAG: lysylphosphatidylglycerol synthase domain-containing protein, partial [Egibacteraceae bacterium]